ncbi:MAG: hypothetical protein ACRDQ4_05805 [Pseudonocardiaceae bacterium]
MADVLRRTQQLLQDLAQRGDVRAGREQGDLGAALHNRAFTDRVPFGVVAVEQPGRGPPVHRDAKLPRPLGEQLLDAPLWCQQCMKGMAVDSGEEITIA